jgi:hypothetical protein
VGNLILEIEKMNSYPYIGKGIKSGSTALIYEQSKCIAIESKTWAVADFELCDDINESYLTNITTEYLANNYGEVKSKEHAEFIKLLAEVNNILVEGREPSKANWFSFRYISGNLTLTLLSHKSSLVIESNRKQITIPLPPESNVNTPEEDFEMKQIAKNNDITINVKNSTDSVVQVTKCEDEKVVHITINEPPKNNTTYTCDDFTQDAERLRKTMEAINKHDALKNNGDNLIFGDADKCEEWPCVGSKVTWGEREIIGTVKCIDNGWSWILCPDGKYTQQGVKYLKPPKTEDEKLRDEVKAVISEAMKNPLGFLCNADDELTDYMFKSFNITKKPQ